MTTTKELAEQINAGVHEAVVMAQQRICELNTDVAYYKAEAEKHNASANDLAQRLAHWIGKHDEAATRLLELEAENARLKVANDLMDSALLHVYPNGCTNGAVFELWNAARAALEVK